MSDDNGLIFAALIDLPSRTAYEKLRSELLPSIGASVIFYKERFDKSKKVYIITESEYGLLLRAKGGRPNV